MSTANTRVIRNITTFVATPQTGNAANVVSIMEIRLTDRTRTLTTGSDNDAAYRHFAGNYECEIEVICEDPLQAQGLKGMSNAAVTFLGVDLTGNGNVNVTVTGVSFRQPSLPDARYSEQARSSISGTGGQITFA